VNQFISIIEARTMLGNITRMSFDLLAREDEMFPKFYTFSKSTRAKKWLKKSELIGYIETECRAA